MKKFIYASLGAAAYGQITTSRRERFGLHLQNNEFGRNVVDGEYFNYSRDWYKSSDAGMKAKKACKDKFLQEKQEQPFRFRTRYNDQGEARQIRDDKIIINCLAGFVAQDTQRMVEYGPRGSHCYAAGTQLYIDDPEDTYFDTYYDPELLNCLMDAHRQFDACPPELTAIPMISNFVDRVKTPNTQENNFYWCFFNEMKSYMRKQGENFEDDVSAWSLSRLALGECEKQAGFDVHDPYFETFNGQEKKVLSLLFKRNCRLSFQEWDQSPCIGGQEWTDDGVCRNYQCTCPGNGLAPDADIHDDADSCDQDGKVVCHECDDGWTGEFCDQEYRECLSYEYRDNWDACRFNQCSCESGNGLDIDMENDTEEIKELCDTDGKNICASCTGVWTGDTCEGHECDEVYQHVLEDGTCENFSCEDWQTLNTQNGNCDNNVCTCANGSLGNQEDCTVAGEPNCASCTGVWTGDNCDEHNCDEVYQNVLGDGTCENFSCEAWQTLNTQNGNCDNNVCTCANGSLGDQEDCTVAGEPNCASCTGEWTGDNCDEHNCNLETHTVNEDGSCEAICTETQHLDDGQCVDNQCVCENGTLGEQSNCFVDGAANCASCNDATKYGIDCLSNKCSYDDSAADGGQDQTLYFGPDEGTVDEFGMNWVNLPNSSNGQVRRIIGFCNNGDWVDQYGDQLYNNLPGRGFCTYDGEGYDSVDMIGLTDATTQIVWADDSVENKLCQCSNELADENNMGQLSFDCTVDGDYPDNYDDYEPTGTLTSQTVDYSIYYNA